MKPSDLPAMHIPGTPTLSPDARSVAVAVRRIDADADDYTSQVWLVAADGSAPPRKITHGWRDADPRYSPDGRWLAFTRATRDSDGTVGKPQVYVMPTAGGEPRRLTDHPLGAGTPSWSPDSTRLAYTARVPEPGRYGTTAPGADGGRPPDKEPPRRITRLSHRFDNLGFTGDRRSQVWLVDVLAEDAAPVQVTSGDFDHRDVTFSPDGSLLAFAAARHDNHDNDLVCDVWTCGADGSGVRRVTAGTLAAAGPRFSPDGGHLCFTGHEVAPPVATRNTGLWTVPVDGSAPPRRLTDAERFNLAYHGAIEVTDRGVLFPDEHRGAARLLLVPYGGGEPEVLLDGHRQVIAAAYAAGTVVATVATPEHAGEVVALEARPGGVAGERRLTAFAAALGGVEIRPMIELDATAPDGYPVHGWLVRPDGPGPHPVLLMIHGGPFTQYGWALFDEAQVYAGGGYAVVMGNPRGSSGYGQAHGQAIVGDVGRVSALDLNALLDHALAGGHGLDAVRVGVLGGSHGGYMTTWMAAHHGDRFKAAASERAVNAIDSFTGSSDIGWFFADDLYGSDPDVQARQSPLTYADRIDIPMLIIHSEQDWRCPVEQAQRLFVALKRRGVPVELLLFPGEGHEMSRSGLPSHRLARFEAILDWFGRYL